MKPLTIAVSDYETDVVRAVFKGLQEARVPVEDIIPLSSEASVFLFSFGFGVPSGFASGGFSGGASEKL